MVTSSTREKRSMQPRTILTRDSRRPGRASYKGILENKKNWKLINTLDLSAYGAVIFGITEAKMEGRAFDIAAEKWSSDSYKFPGIDDDAALPID